MRVIEIQEKPRLQWRKLIWLAGDVVVSSWLIYVGSKIFA